jgi:hypothetical protein
MRRLLVGIVLTLMVSPHLFAAGLRAPSCEAMVAFALGARVDPIELSFGKSPAVMTVDEFDQALDIVKVCLDNAEAGPADIPGLWVQERRRTKITVLSTLSEDLRLYRSRLRDRERRAAREGKLAE